ncbi:hypothetical protein [Phenylobacterium sp.]|uniref:hypothetical protein n=1 Tax=Phenylobacterium sp. TaxID=1871053 RepID=UPI002732FA75|nr:hypothetical protein [Phenylobacterium sp.]MDP3631602.1 hypothetical protein [Phenylobacterium sp.]
MDETAVTPSDLAIEAILIALADDLEAALDAVASAGAERRFEEIMTRCGNAAALAQAGQLLTARSNRR